MDRRDTLALERTQLANERTLLAYVRTSLALAGGGAGVVHFFPAALLQVLGWLLIVLGGVLLVVGVRRFRAVERRLTSPEGPR